MVAKTNVLTFAHDLWMRTFTEVSRDYPEIKTGLSTTSTPAACGWSSAPSGTT